MFIVCTVQSVPVVHLHAAGWAIVSTQPTKLNILSGVLTECLDEPWHV